MEELTKIFAAILRELELPEAKLNHKFSLTNLFGLDDAIQEAIDAGHDLDAVGFAIAGARVLVRFEREA